MSDLNKDLELLFSEIDLSDARMQCEGFWELFVRRIQTKYGIDVTDFPNPWISVLHDRMGPLDPSCDADWKPGARLQRGDDTVLVFMGILWRLSEYPSYHPKAMKVRKILGTGENGLCSLFFGRNRHVMDELASEGWNAINYQ